MSTPDTTAMEVAKAFLVPLIVALVVGVGSTWLTLQVAMAEVQQQVEEHTIAIEQLRSGQRDNAAAQRDNERDMVDRLARVETKLDLILQEKRNDND